MKNAKILHLKISVEQKMPFSPYHLPLTKKKTKKTQTTIWKTIQNRPTNITKGIYMTFEPVYDQQQTGTGALYP